MPCNPYSIGFRVVPVGARHKELKRLVYIGHCKGVNSISHIQQRDTKKASNPWKPS